MDGLPATCASAACSLVNEVVMIGLGISEPFSMLVFGKNAGQISLSGLLRGASTNPCELEFDELERRRDDVKKGAAIMREPSSSLLAHHVCHSV